MKQIISVIKKTWLIIVIFILTFFLTKGLWQFMATFTLFILTWIIEGSLWRWMADRAIIWFRVPFMHAAIFLKDRGVDKVAVVCTEKKEKQILDIIPEEEKHLYEFHQIGKPFFIGLPWSGYSLHSWYINSRDIDDPQISPRFKATLAEMTWDYIPPKGVEERKSFIETWSVDTKDPVQVFPELAIYVEIVDVIKSLFNIEHYEEAIQKEISAVWKKSVATLEYMKYEKGETDKEGKEITGVGDLQTKAQINLNTLFFGENKPPSEIGELTDGTPAKRILDEFGVFVKQILIRNIDPTDDVIRASLQEKIKAQATAAATLETAKGARDAQKTKADGKEYEIKKIGEAEASIIRLKINAQSDGLKKIATDLELNKNDRSLLYIANMVEKMMTSSNHSLVMGGPGDLGQSILAAANMMSGGLDKVKKGDTTGLDDIKKSIQGLDKESKQQLKILLEEAPKVKKEE